MDTKGKAWRESPGGRSWRAKYRASRRDKIRIQQKANWLKSNYGISLEAYEAMAAGQDRRCLICGKRRPLVVDHNHRTGGVRGLLCHRCNSGLGFYEDSPDLCLSAAQYLKERNDGNY